MSSQDSVHAPAAAENGRRYHRDDLRGSLLRTAMAMLEAAPAQRLSMREVARKAGVSHQAPYHHFAGRDALMRELRDNAMREFLADQERAAARHDDPAARMLAVAMAYVDFARRRPRAFALVFDTDLCPPHDRTPSRDALITANEELFARCLADLRAVGWRPGVDPDGLGLGVWAAVHGTAALVTGGYMPPDQAERALRAVFAGAA